MNTRFTINAAAAVAPPPCPPSCELFRSYVRARIAGIRAGGGAAENARVGNVLQR